MAYTALYRVYRPDTFGDIVGQSHVTTTLRNALREGRLSHAYLFNGPRGTGKTSAAKILAKAVNCENPQDGEPCNACNSCKAISGGVVTDVLEIDAASNRGVEEIRDIRDKVKFAPSDVKYKVYIIDEVHMLTTEAFNALLKTLEEPPSHVMFILATTEPHKLPATIISRCQRFDFHRIALSEIVGRLQQICTEQQVEADEQALLLVAKMSEGGMRDALSLLDQAISYSGDRVTTGDILQITGSVAQTYFSTVARMIAEQDVANVLEQFNQVMAQGKDPEHFLQDLMHYYRDMLLLKTAPGLKEAVDRTLLDDQFAGVAESYELPVLYEIIESLNQSLTQLKWSSYARVLAELSLVKLCQMAGGGLPQQSGAAATSEPTARADAVEILVKRVRSLEEKLELISRGQVKTEAEASNGESRQTEPRRPRAAGGPAHASTQKLQRLASSLDEAMTQRIRGAWAQILAELKKIKIQYQAWLVSGQPAIVSGDTLIVTFKSTIHCEKTMEPELKSVVERVVHDLTGRPLQLLSVMEEQWQSVEADAAVPETDDQQEAEDPFVSEAIKLVGEQLVEVKE
ncbi:DNA polymerase III subunit gamma/tau [Brevibacillus humidisoli]|uniref:DNA polymerase III subunit gamma/tau n=1 Tax=Brevibacillus humidisoli TaxID=2895522 RepID=UPI001E42F325|nr:DNA polymerase III subunit gamma/tau [Brevibacillus humidisoli]UFJ40506.1 DNA polymerase III subunit gamma/tau [Brevibacillus humidisoli]